MTRVRTSFLAVCAVLLWGCVGELSISGPAGPIPDTGPRADSGPGVDGGPGMDAGPGVDGGPGADSGPGVDSGPRVDSGPSEPECGDGRTEGTERCDGDCPTSCAPRMCETGRLRGDATMCSSYCDYSPVTTCMNDDGCCPSSCSPSTDNDCTGLDCRDYDSWPTDWAAEEVRAVDEMNRHRLAGTDCPSGPKPPVPALVLNRELRIAARCHSMDMATNNFFSHTGSDGSNFSARVRDAGYTGGPRAENIAAGNGTGVASVGQWMTSTSGHCDANMNSGYNEVGIGYMRLSGTMWTHYWTANFGSR